MREIQGLRKNKEIPQLSQKSNRLWVTLWIKYLG